VGIERVSVSILPGINVLKSPVDQGFLLAGVAVFLMK